LYLPLLTTTPTLSIIFHLVTIFNIFLEKNLLVAIGDCVQEFDIQSSSLIRTFRGNYSSYTFNCTDYSCIRNHHGYVGHHYDKLFCLAITVDSERLLSGGQWGLVHLWSLSSGEQLSLVQAHSSSISCLAVTRDGSSFVSGSKDHSLKLWRFDALQQPVLHFIGHTDPVSACALSPGGSRLYSASRESIRLWDTTTGLQLAIMMPGEDSNPSKFALSGSLLVYPSNLTKILCDTSSLKCFTFGHSPGNHIRCVAVTNHNKRLIFGGCYYDYMGGPCHLLVQEVASRQMLGELRGHEEEIELVSVSDDDCWAASTSFAGTICTICVWDLNSLSLHTKFSLPNGVQAVLLV
jgi:WD40 repeat protein